MRDGVYKVQLNILRIDCGIDVTWQLKIEDLRAHL